MSHSKHTLAITRLLHLLGIILWLIASICVVLLFVKADNLLMAVGLMVGGLICTFVGYKLLGTDLSYYTAPQESVAPVTRVVSSAPVYQRPVPRFERIDGRPLAYSYVLPLDKPLETGGKELLADVRASGNVIEYVIDGAVVGCTADEQKAKMVSDFSHKGEPCCAYILSDGQCANLRFFRDKRLGQEGREQEVIELLACYNDEKQEAISSLEEGDELEIEESAQENIYHVYRDGVKIGSLPARIGKRLNEEWVYGVFFEDGGYDYEKDKYTPSVRIYW